MRRYKDSQKAVVGDIVCVHVDIRDRNQCNNLGFLGIVFEVGSGGGARIATQHGVLGQRQQESSPYYLPTTAFSIKANTQTLPPALDATRHAIIRGKFDPGSRLKITVKKAQQLFLGLENLLTFVPTRRRNSVRGNDLASFFANGPAFWNQEKMSATLATA